MQVIGLCRFSYPGFGAFKTDFADMTDKHAYLYAPDRLDERFACFELFTLPSLRGQLDTDYSFVIVIGDSLPARYRDRLHDLVADMPQVTIAPHPPGPHRKVMAQAIADVRRKVDQPCLQFRLDDDDAIGIGFVAHLRETARNLQPFARHHPQIALDYNTGFVARPTPQGIEAAPIRTPYWTSALALMFQPGAPGAILDWGHGTLWRKMPTVTQTGEDMLLRGINRYNDSLPRKGRNVPQMHLLDADGALRFAMSYNIDNTAVKQHMAQLGRKDTSCR